MARLIIVRVLVFLALVMTLMHVAADDLDVIEEEHTQEENIELSEDEDTDDEDTELSEEEDTDSSDVIELYNPKGDDQTQPDYWLNRFQSDKWFVYFYSETCKVCENITSVWEEFGTLAKEKAPHLKVAKLDTGKNKFSHYSLGGGPTPNIVLFFDGERYTVLESREPRTPKQYLKFALKTYKKEERQRQAIEKQQEERRAKKAKDVDLTSKVIRLTSKTIDQVGSGNWVIDFYGAKCKICKKIDDKWEKLAYFAHRSKMDFKVARFDCTQKGGDDVQKSFKARPWPFIVRMKDSMVYTHPEPRNFAWDVEDYVEWAETGFEDEYGEKFLPDLYEKLAKRAARKAKYGTKKKKKEEL